MYQQSGRKTQKWRVKEREKINLGVGPWRETNGPASLTTHTQGENKRPKMKTNVKLNGVKPTQKERKN